MEVKKAENHQIKSITPIKGEILAKLRSKLIRTNKSNAANSEATLNNNNQNGQTNTQVKKEVEPDKKIIIKSVENVHIDLTSIIPNNTAHSHVTATRSDPIVKSDEDSKQPVKILSAKMPENDFNKKIPLKMVRTIQRPKPNVQQRRQCFGKVQVYQSSSDSSIPLKTTPEPVQPEIVNMMQQPEHPVEIFKGFTEEEQRDHMLDKLSLWKELLSMDESALKSIWESSQNQTLPSASESQIITDSMVDSSMMREFAKDLDETEPPEESDDGSMSGSEMDESSDDQSDTEMEIDNAPWLQDIDDLIGEARIKEIEESLKKIPTTATGNLIETENIELKLIINHLLRKINAQSIVETMNPDVTYAASKNIVTESIGIQTSNNISTESIGIQASNNTSTVSKGIQASKNVPTASKSIQASNNILTASKSIQASNNILTESIGIQTSNEIHTASNVPVTLNNEPITKAIEDKNESSSEDDDTAGHFDDNPGHFDDSPEPFDVDDMPMEFAKEEKSGNINEPLCEDKMPTVEESKIAEMPEVNVDVPMPSVPEVPEDISAIEEEPIAEEIIEEQGTPKEAKSHAERKRKNEIFPLATSTAKKLRSEPTYEFVNKQQDTQPPPQEDNTVNEVSRPRRGRQKAKLQKVVVVLEDYSKVVKPVHEKSPERAPSPPPPMIQEINQLREDEGPPSRRTRRYSKIVSESDVPSKSPFCKIELKSHDLNSTESANIVCDDYLNAPSSPPLDQARNREPVSAMSVVEQVTESVAEIKTVDPTFYSTGQKEKRPYLRTSAFKGNQNDESNISLEAADSVSNPNDTPEDLNSISNEPSHEETINEEQSKPEQKLSLKELMQSLIEGKKEIIAKSKQQTPAKSPVSKKKVETKRVEKPKKSYKELVLVPKKVFEQEPLEPAIESKVPYDSIIESIRVSNPPRGRETGKAVWTGSRFDQKEIKTWRDKLKKQKHFRCGMCKFLVTKHKWKQHLETHGGFTYIDGFEVPLDINNFNESLRRIIQYCKIYKIESLRCPNCDAVKRSPLGQMSHIYICAEDEETLESRKACCEMCNEKFYPFTMSAHKRACKGSEIRYKDVSDSSENEEDETLYTPSGRAKRKAVQKAEKKLKTIVNKLSDEQGSDFGDSSSEEFENKSDESSESEEESSGVDEDEQSSVDDSEIDEDDSNILKFSEKGRKKAYETAELKLAKNVIQPFVEDIRSKKISFKIYELNRKFIEEFFSDEIFPNFTSDYQTLSQTLRSFSTQLRFRPSSINYVSRQIDNYLTNFESSQVKSDWNELSFGARDLNDSSHILMYCGGSISSMDWAPAEDGDHFLAVACNPNDIQHKLGIEETMKSCVQIYEFNSLVNEKFENFENITSRLLYTFAINDGPIWSVKFHPCGQASNERIGILAVTTAQQDVYIFSLPYLNNNNTPAVIELKPNVICRLSEDMTLYQDKFLMQATRVNWHYERDRVNVLAVGYVSGDVALWNFEEREDEGNLRYPDIVIQAHHQTITAVDMKPSKNGNYLLLTTCLGREIKLFSINGCRYEELTFSQPQSRILCAEMWRHWAGYVNGNDNSFLLGYVNHRQPFDFGRKNTTLLNPASSIISVNINHWTNSVLITTDAGDVVTVTPHQVASTDPKDKWSAFFTTIVSFTDIKRIPQKNQAPDELGIVFNDLKNNATKKPKNFRVSPIELTNQLQVNHACFNPNEKSHGFFALGYETGFVRIRHMKNAK